MTERATTLATGGARQVPVPDPIARDYLLLALRLDQHVPGLVDGYFGPADLKAEVEVGQLRAPARLAADADALLARLPREEDSAQRREWLAAQLVALRTQAAALAGDELPYVEHVTHCFAWTPVRRDDALFDAAAADLEAQLPGPESLADRLAAWDARFEIPVDRLPGVIDWLVGRFRAQADALFGLPPGEHLKVNLVTDQPWSGYNWYDGGRRSRVDINIDLPVRSASLVHTVAHETFPGHHLENAWKEADLVDGLGRLEASILLINTPECLLSEGLADLGYGFASPIDEEADLLIELYDRAGLPIAADPTAARDAAQRTVAMRRPRRALSAVLVNAALMRHADGASHEETFTYLEEVGRQAPHLVEKRLDFLEHPLWRTYVFVYDEGEELLRQWLEVVPETDRATRFGRLLHEQLTPTAIAGELAAGIVRGGQPAEA